MMPKLPPHLKRSHPAYVALRPGEVKRLDQIMRRTKRTRSAILREAFLSWIEERQPFFLASSETPLPPK